MTRRDWDTGDVLVAAALLLVAAGAFVGLLVWSRLAFVVAVVLCVTHGLSWWLPNRGLRAELEAVRNRKDTAVEAAFDTAFELQRVSGEHEATDVGPEVPAFMADSGYRAPSGLDDGLVWCVKHRDGWCATADKTEPAEGTTFVETLCGANVSYPWGYDRRRPDCVECVAFVRHNDDEADLGPLSDEEWDGFAEGAGICRCADLGTLLCPKHRPVEQELIHEMDVLAQVLDEDDR